MSKETFIPGQYARGRDQMSQQEQRAKQNVWNCGWNTINWAEAAPGWLWDFNPSSYSSSGVSGGRFPAFGALTCWVWIRYLSVWYKLHSSSLSSTQKQITDERVRPHSICWGHIVSLIAYELSLYICETAGGHYDLVGNNTLQSLVMILSCVYLCVVVSQLCWR